MNLDWQARAACRDGVMKEAFFPGRDSDTRAYVHYAKAVCSACPVCRDCLAYALSFGCGPERVTGIWGGTTEQQRLRMTRYCANCSKRLNPWEMAESHGAGLALEKWTCRECRRQVLNTRRPDAPATRQRLEQARKTWGQVRWEAS